MSTVDLFAEEEALQFVPPQPQPLTDDEWARVLEGRNFRCLVDAAKVEWAGDRAVRCGSCTHSSGSHKVPWSGFCRVHRCMVSDTFAKLCREFKRA